MTYLLKLGPIVCVLMVAADMQVVKHVFPAHLVLQFDCANTVQEQILEDVTVAIDLAEAVCLGFC